MSQDELKRAAAATALESVESGMALGLGTGSTVRHLVDLLGEAPAIQDTRKIVHRRRFSQFLIEFTQFASALMYSLFEVIEHTGKVIRHRQRYRYQYGHKAKGQQARPLQNAVINQYVIEN